MSAARSDLCEVSPITQRSASTRFDLPQPFGPTTPVRPGSIRKSVGSTKDLNPISRSRVSFISMRFPFLPRYEVPRCEPHGPRMCCRQPDEPYDGGKEPYRIGAENEYTAPIRQT